MPRLIFLGTSNAIASQHHENTHMILVGQERTLLIDCTGNPIARVQRYGIHLADQLSDLLLTHFHADHVSGAALLLQTAWLIGRKASLNLYGLSFTLERMREMLDLFNWEDWPDAYPIVFHTIPEVEHAPVFKCNEFRVFTSPVHHLIPNIAVRVEFPASGRAFAYSSDTAPCDEVARLAQGVDVLIHESNGVHPGHSSAEQAGEIARRAGTKSLYLIHYPTLNSDPRPLIGEARRAFEGPVYLAEDFMELEF
jgi:ribonuclease Z